MAAALLRSLTLTPNEAAKHGLSHQSRRARSGALSSCWLIPMSTVARLASIWPEIGNLDPDIAEQLAVDARYAVYVKRQELDIASFRKDEGIAIPTASASPRSRTFDRAPPEARAPPARKPRARRRGSTA